MSSRRTEIPGIRRDMANSIGTQRASIIVEPFRTVATSKRLIGAVVRVVGADERLVVDLRPNLDQIRDLIEALQAVVDSEERH